MSAEKNVCVRLCGSVAIYFICIFLCESVANYVFRTGKSTLKVLPSPS
jgi:hypothetical protein